MINESIRNSLVNKTYIHSNTDNFVSINLNFLNLKRSQKMTDYLISAKNQIEKYIIYITNQCNNFYSDIGLMKRDNFDSKTGKIFLDGAREFSLKYLGVSKKQKNKEFQSFSSKFLTIIDSLDFKTVFYSKLKNLSPPEVDFERFANDWNQMFEKQATKQIEIISDAGVNELVDIISKRVNSLFENKKLRKLKQGWASGLRLRSTYLSRGKNNLLSGLNTEQALENTRGAEQLKQEILQKYIEETKTTPMTIVDALWETLIECGLDNVTEEDEKKFKQYYLKALERRGDSFNIKNTSQYSGFILEDSVAFSLSQDFQSNEFIKEIRVTGQDYVTKYYKNSFNDDITSKNVESGTDMEIEIEDNQGNTRIYKFQDKNSFGQSLFDAIHLQSQIHVDTYAYTVLDAEEAKELEYLVFNKAYLSQWGVDEKGSANKYKHQDQLNKYINFFLYETLAYLVAGKIKQEANSSNQQFQGNIFFIFKGKYLMPTSIFLYSAYQLILKLLDSETSITKMDTVGKLVYNQKLTGVSFTSNQAKRYRNRKLDVVKDYWKPVHQVDADRDLSYYYKYPEAMQYIGAEIGEIYRRKASFGKISFSTALDQLDQFLK